MAYNRSEHWRPIIEQFEVSGLTQSDFAEQYDINVATLRYWIYKFRDQQVAQNVDFLEVKSMNPSESSNVSMYLPNDIIVEFSQSPDARFFATLAHELSKLS